ncbi:hypothetical protein AX774_g3013, partial [Zancudomyces culisetae]
MLSCPLYDSTPSPKQRCPHRVLFVGTFLAWTLM